MLCRTTFFAISLVSFAAQAYAQSSTSQPASVPAAPQVLVPGYYGGYYGRSSTLQEGIQHGYADVLRAEGEQAYNMGRTANQFEEAREKSLKNRQQSVQQYFALRDMNQSHRSARHSRPTTKTVTRTAVSHPSAATKVSVVGYDGRIEWPAALAGRETSDARGQLDRLFSQRASGREVRTGSKEYRHGCTAIEKLQTELKDSISTLPPAEYLAAKKMLQSLKQELTQPVDQDLLTQN